MLTYLFYRVIGLQVGPSNIAIPISLISQDDVQLTFTFYIQIMDVFLMRENLLEAVLVNKFAMSV